MAESDAQSGAVKEKPAATQDMDTEYDLSADRDLSPAYLDKVMPDHIPAMKQPAPE